MTLPPLTLPTAAAVSSLDSNNRLGLDYAHEATHFPALGYGIIDAHAHINGLVASELWHRAARAYGIECTYSMTKLEDVAAFRARFGAAIEFIAIPDWNAPDRRVAQGASFLDRIDRFHALGAGIVKFWNAPRVMDFARELQSPGLFALDGELRTIAMEHASRLGMSFMVHVADPDTWFATKYSDAAKYGTKRDHYVPLERALDRFDNPWLAAHLGGWPEDLEFLDGLLERHPNLHLDTSATKWIVRALGSHSRAAVLQFLEKFAGRILFGSDTVTSDEHLRTGEKSNEMAMKATSESGAYDLYASRFWALRMMWEGEGSCASPIADPDLHLVDPITHTTNDAPVLRGLHLPPALLRSLYRDAAVAFFKRGF
ncbi:MAG: hypothetical protein EXS10_01295 [Phycisphaerales bacterium]|nr:hypothetical protein [Phycisphaerales bacterium]